MNTVEVKIEGNVMVIRVPMNGAPVPSSTGKTLVVASTHGGIRVPVQVDGKPLVVNVNAYIK